MAIWQQTYSLTELNQQMQGTLAETLDIRVDELGEDYLRGSMPVDERTRQPMGILHGGASVALAETLGSFAATLAADPGTACVGLDINANHLRSVRQGRVTATARPLHVGRSTQVWEILLCDEADRKVCASRLTMAVLPADTVAAESTP